MLDLLLFDCRTVGNSEWVASSADLPDTVINCVQIVNHKRGVWQCFCKLVWEQLHPGIISYEGLRNIACCV